MPRPADSRRPPGSVPVVSPPPHDDRAELAILGGLIVFPERLSEVGDLEPAAFYRSRHQALWRALRRLAEDGSPIEPARLLARAAPTENPDDDLKAQQRKARRRADLGRIVADATEGIPRNLNLSWNAERLRELAAKRDLTAAGIELSEAAQNGRSTADLATMARALVARAERQAEVPTPLDLLSDAVRPNPPSFMVEGLLREVGVSHVWAQPGGLKTRILACMSLEFLWPDCRYLFGHPELIIHRHAKRILLVTTEEEAGELRYILDTLRRGLGDPEIPGELLHLHGVHGRRLTLDDLPALMGRHGPIDLVILDSLTGLRPKTVDGERVRWDVDNDANNESMLALRSLAIEHQTHVLFSHHSDKGVNNYRGPTELWASPDTLIGLLSEGTRIKVMAQKVRGASVPAAFFLEPEWTDGALTIRYGGPADKPETKLRDAMQRTRDFLVGRGPTPQSDIAAALGLKRQTARDALRDLQEKGLAEPTGKKGRHGSPEWEATEPAMPGGDG